ncbi:hypothetical protein EMMF5_004271 [Cystobasidiomycetes sp. EMM_F5]
MSAQKDADDDGASPIQQLLYAAKTDSLELAKSCLDHPKLGDVNKPDGLGCTALHYAAKGPSPEVLELLLEFEGTDVDPQDKLDGNTPLHYAVQLSADTRITNRYKQKAVDLLPPDSELRKDFERAEAEAALDSGDLVAADDIASDGEEGGESGED